MTELDFAKTGPFAEAVAQLEDHLAQSPRIFLLGAGCSKCCGLPLTTELADLCLQSKKLDEQSHKLLSAVRECFEGAAGANIEDYLSELVDWLALAERREQRGASNPHVQIGEETYSREAIGDTIECLKQVIREHLGSEVDPTQHRRFVSAVHRTQRDGRVEPGRAVDYVVLNYDTILEGALGLERIPYTDGLDGGETGWWAPSAFERDGLLARVYKLHGSIDWQQMQDETLPRRVGRNIKMPDSSTLPLMIWPASTKYRETQLDPYAQLLARVRTCLTARPGSQRVLVVCGYSFSDDHINREVDHALRESSGNLTVLAFTESEEPQGILDSWHSDPSVSDQLLIYARGGFFHGQQVQRSALSLPWWKFEVLTRLLEGER